LSSLMVNRSLTDFSPVQSSLWVFRSTKIYDQSAVALAGRYTMDEEFDALVKKGKKTEKEVEGMKQLANEIQYAVHWRCRAIGRRYGCRTFA
jgi:hypothetical protein